VSEPTFVEVEIGYALRRAGAQKSAVGQEGFEGVRCGDAEEVGG